MEFCTKNAIPYIRGVDYMDIQDYRDGIHINEKGQNKLSEFLFDYLKNINGLKSNES